jgi:protein disulfide-isomerase
MILSEPISMKYPYSKNRFMKKRVFVALAVLSFAAMTSYGVAGQWLTDVPTALARAKAENKSVLLDFTGSDWCGWCIRLKEEVFDEPAFAAYAKESLILVELDFPKGKPQTPQLRAANEALARKFGVRGFPTIIVLDANGNKLLQGGYAPGGAANYVSLLKKGINKTPAPSVSAEAPAAPPAPAKVATPIQPAPPTIFSELSLKGIVGSKNRRFALINNQTLAVGEKAMIRMQNGPVEIVCQEIRDDSVLVLVKGEAEPKELKVKK